MTTIIHNYPTRVSCSFQGKKGQLAIDQVKTVDKIRLQKKLATMASTTADKYLDVLIQYFQH